MEKKQIIKVSNKPLNNLNCSIHKVLYPYYKDDCNQQNYYIFEFSICDSLGEQGYYLTEFFDNYPSEEEIYQFIKEHIFKEYQDLNNKVISGREEQYLKVFEKILNILCEKMIKEIKGSVYL